MSCQIMTFDSEFMIELSCCRWDGFFFTLLHKRLENYDSYRVYLSRKWPCRRTLFWAFGKIIGRTLAIYGASWGGYPICLAITINSGTLESIFKGKNTRAENWSRNMQLWTYSHVMLVVLPHKEGSSVGKCSILCNFYRKLEKFHCHFLIFN